MALHSNYPHFPGYLIGCPACDFTCHCGPGVEDGTDTECVFIGHDETDDTYVSRCPVCGEHIDYCQGHGEMGDPIGYEKMAEHDLGNHDWCHSNATCDD